MFVAGRPCALRLQASPRWGVFDQSGDVELAVDADGPYIYAAFDDAGELGGVSLDAGTPYAGCKAADGTVTPEYEISTTKRITAGDWAFGEIRWRHVSQPAKAAVQEMLHPDAARRPAAARLLERQWLQGAAPSCALPESDQRLRAFNKARRRWRQIKLVVRMGSHGDR